ncbi:hypothetical protein GLOIN_2v1773040 [Rhizophagus clarus]|nr:hypothetical protein GLOIN_2v1773040 [Rhizophagus clarus]
MQEHLTSVGDNCDYEFFLQILDNSASTFHVTCKLIPNSLILNLLNKEIYGINFDVAAELNTKYLLTLCQKLNLERNLKQILPSYFHPITDNGMLLSPNGNNENLSLSRENIESNIDSRR